MVKEESSQITRRETRSSALAKCSNNTVEETDTSSRHPNDASLSFTCLRRISQQYRMAIEGAVISFVFQI
ncbi:hypothetical protein M0R45_034354 [Rubus argutus]|uniref:Uncharacterized protein n=1 Tax=Rubus argutus TaxID=59490 RepID=A0AAW1VPU6_RUBAR